MQAAVAASKNPLSLFAQYEGKEHGTPFFTKHRELEDRIVRWLETALR